MWQCGKQQKCVSANHVKHVESSAINEDTTNISINNSQFETTISTKKWASPLQVCYQHYSYCLGDFLQQHFRKVLLSGVLLLSLCCLGLLSIQFETKQEKLWISDDFRKQQTLAALQAMDETSEMGYVESLLHIEETKDKSPALSTVGLLNSASILRHLNALRRIIRNVEVEGPDRVQYNYEKLCIRPAFPQMHAQNSFTHLIDSLMPCQLITPLDCFWEGAKLRGPNHALQFGGHKQRPISWSNFNPVARIHRFQRKYPNKDFTQILEFFKTMGVSTGYTRKPCLQPNDTECPPHVVKRQKTESPNVVTELQNGCKSFASKLMHWKRELLLGGLTTSNDSLTSNGQPQILAASAMMSTLFLKSARNLHEDIKRNIPHTAWTVEQSEQLIKTWLRLLRKEISQLDEDARINSQERFLTVNELALDDESLLNSIPSYLVLLCPSCLVVIYLTFIFVSWRNCLCSSSAAFVNESRWIFLAVAGTLLMCLALAAALGIAALFQLPFNMLTMQLLPGLSLGLASSDWLNLVTAFHHQQRYSKDPVGLVLQDQTLPILHGNCALLAVFLMGSLSSFPALRIFCFQASLVTVLQCLNCLILLPSLLSMEMACRKNFCSIFCDQGALIEAKSNEFKSESCLDGGELPTALNTKIQLGLHGPEAVLTKSMHSINRSLSTSGSYAFLLRSKSSLADSRRTTSRPFVYTGLSLACIVFAVLSAAIASYGLSLLTLGFEWDLVIPKKTSVATAISAQSKYFGLQSVHIVVGETDSNFNFVYRQDLLHQFHKELRLLPNLLMVGTSRHIFWLDALRDWLHDKQSAFDAAVRKGSIRTNGTWTKDASDRGLLGMRLLLLTGEVVDQAIDKRRLISGRLVDNSGQIYPAAFNQYLRVWYTMDQLTFMQLQTVLHPTPAPLVIDLHSNTELSIPACDPLKFTLMTLSFHGVKNSDNGMHLINILRRMSDKFSAQDLPNSVSGFLFKYLAQITPSGHFYFRLTAMIAFGLAIPVLLTLVLMVGNVRVVLLSCLPAPLTAIQLGGLHGAFGYRLNYMSLLVLLLSCALATRLANQFITMYMGLMKRYHLSLFDCLLRTLRIMIRQLLHGAILNLLGVVFLVNIVYDFIGLYFFKFFAVGVTISFMNVIILLPALIHLCGLNCNVEEEKHEKEEWEKPSLNPDLSSSEISLDQIHDGETSPNLCQNDPLHEKSLIKNDCIRDAQSNLNIVSLASARLSTILEEINERSLQSSMMSLVYKEHLREIRTSNINKCAT